MRTLKRSDCGGSGFQQKQLDSRAHTKLGFQNTLYNPIVMVLALTCIARPSEKGAILAASPVPPQRRLDDAARTLRDLLFCSFWEV